MRYLTTTCVLILLSAWLAKAADPGSAVLLRSGTIHPEKNVTEFVSEVIPAGDVVDGYYFRLVQFTEFPSEAVKVQMRKSGLLFNSYIPYKAYMVAIPSGYDRSKLIGFGANSVISWKREFKLHPDLTGHSFPEHTLVNSGMVDLIVHYQSNLQNERATQLLIQAGFQVLKSYESIHAVEVRIDKNKMGVLESLPFIYSIEPIAPPSRKDDTEGRSLHRSNVVNSDYATGRHYDGSGVTVAIADDGVVGPHIDFTGRIEQHMLRLGGNHGDMTSGICVGAGNLDPRIRGMASGAFIHIYDIGGYDHIVNAQNYFDSLGTVISSTSYSQGCNEYTTASQLGDQLIHDNSQLIFCFSAGNDGTGNCGYGAGSFWGNITGGYKVGKNVIATGNLNAGDVLEASSSRGPAPDGRVKPDICANGIDQLSTDQDNTYQVGGGTSAASPGIGGVMAQLYQAYKEIAGDSAVRSDLMKACLLNGAEDLGNPGPDYKHGWGRVNAFRSIRTIEDGRYLMDSIAQSGTNDHVINVPSGVRQLRVMIYWHDEGGNPVATKSLVNDLNMQVEDPTAAMFNPWILNPAPNATTLNAPAVRGIDSLNNVEQVTIEDPASGNYTVHVDGNQIPLGVQKYVMVYEFRTDSIYVIYPNGGEGLVPQISEYVRWDAYDTAGTFDVSYSPDNGTSWNTIVAAVPGTDRYCGWGIPNLVTDRVLVRVTRGANSDVSDSLCTIIRKPSNIQVAFACPDSIGLTWNAVTGATGYEVTVLGEKYMDPIGTSSGTSFTAYGLNPLVEQWFSVSALGPNGGRGLRANAISTSAALVNCPLSIDGGLAIAYPPSDLITDCQVSSGIPVSINIQNVGTNAVSNFDVHYSFNGGATVTETFTNSIASGANETFTFSQLIATPALGNYDLKAWIDVSGDLNIFNDTSEISFGFLAGVSAPVAYVEDFESLNLCSTVSNCENGNCPVGPNWINADNWTYDGIDWIVDQGGTSTSQTGPSADHTLGTAGGNYVYLEASSSCQDMEALLVSPCFDLTGTTQPFLTYWYHMYGSDQGSLHVDVVSESGVYTDFGPVHSGNLGNLWLKDSISLNQFVGQKISIRFRGITGDGPYSDMALDDIAVLDATTGILEPVGNRLQVYPNPGTGLFNYKIDSRLPALSIVVKDMVGKIVLDKKLNATDKQGLIDLSGQPNGIYMVTLRGESYSNQLKLMKMD